MAKGPTLGPMDKSMLGPLPKGKSMAQVSIGGLPAPITRASGKWACDTAKASSSTPVAAVTAATGPRTSATAKGHLHILMEPDIKEDGAMALKTVSGNSSTWMELPTGASGKTEAEKVRVNLGMLTNLFILELGKTDKKMGRGSL